MMVPGGGGAALLVKRETALVVALDSLTYYSSSTFVENLCIFINTDFMSDICYHVYCVTILFYELRQCWEQLLTT